MNPNYEEYLGIDDDNEADAPKFINGMLTAAGCADRHDVKEQPRSTNPVNLNYGMHAVIEENRLLSKAIELKNRGFKIRTHNGISERLEKFVVRCVKEDRHE